MSIATGFNWRALIGFQLGWFALIFWQNLALVPVAMYWCYGLWCLTLRQRLAVLIILLIGLCIDALLIQRNILQFVSAQGVELMGLPLWFIALWAIFALASVEFMASVLTKPWLAAVLGASGGPLSYYSGAALSGGALQFPSGMWSAVCLIVVWALIAILLGQSRRLYVETA